ncbi:diguanylate cyclase [Pseudoruegeria sp. SK021]|uniref:GGDEF domain-containing protein n=1 Tax=Pseudoruegeria sp. SK021 TaxID=1933035 RepID=UPI000A2530DB|nr:GGDEF domain-containing protein [Pseudoruegeria sp. SK021]OSP54303.1 GGDEF domain-containing protein [Pseudoruegeria sp. SK021]
MGALSISLTHDARDILLPMHLRVSGTGEILHAGPTLRKLRPEGQLIGRQFFDVFDLRRPRGVVTMDGLRQHSGLRLSLQFRDGPDTAFKGVLVADASASELIVNLSFGISIVDAIRDYDLHSADFAPTDLTVEMLYLIEAKSAILEEWRRLNVRLQSAKIAAEEQAFTDTLTGLKNRRAMDHILGRYVDAGVPFGLIQLDLDYFKQVNDKLGHAAGDLVLQKAAEVMLRSTRDKDTLARAGGDEFVLILPETVEAGHLVDLGSRLIERLEVPIPFGDDICRISGSAGITVSLGVPGVSAFDLLGQADKALYASKNTGRGRVTVFSDTI